MQATHSNPPNRRAFTLIELLVVIAVIALLIGIILPALGKAKGQGENAQCKGHLRQYATAHQVYIADHGVMPGLGLSAFSGGLHNGWVTEVGLFDSDMAPVGGGQMALMNGFFNKYVGDPKVFTCPADPLIRYAEVGQNDPPHGRFGHFLTPDEDEQAVGATFSRVWFNRQSEWKPDDYIEHDKEVFVTVGGLTESHRLRFLAVDRLITPAACADIIEEDEESRLDNSVFVMEPSAWSPHPAQPGESNKLSNRHPADSCNVAFFDAHVENIASVVQVYWVEPDFEERVRVLWRNF